MMEKNESHLKNNHLAITWWKNTHLIITRLKKNESHLKKYPSHNNIMEKNESHLKKYPSYNNMMEKNESHLKKYPSHNNMMEMKKFSFENNKLDVEINPYINKENEIWFRGKEIALILGYKNPQRAIRKYIDDDDKKIIDFKIQTHAKDQNSRGTNLVPRAESHKKTFKCYFINESGFYSLILSSKLPSAKKFKRWVTREVLPSIRKKGYYKMNMENVIETENDLHYETVSFLRKKYPEALMIAGLGENQKTEAERIDSWKKGYMAGQCDLMLVNPTRKYSSLCIEFKDPKGNNHLSLKQNEMKQIYIKNKCKYLVTRSATDITYEIIKYMEESKKYNNRRLKRSET